MGVPSFFRSFAATALLPLIGLLVLGCASPGSPKPPSLDLPKVVTDLNAERVGDEVRLRWTTPSETTDGLNVTGATTAQLCRGLRATASGQTPCLPVRRAVVRVGTSGIVDVLPPALAHGPGVLLEYRIELRNRYERAAGQSSPVLAAGGAAPPPVAGLRVAATEQGAFLQWNPEDGEGFVELERVNANSPAMKGATRSASSRASEPATTHLRVPGGTPSQALGGTVDATVGWEVSYTYTAQRLRTIELEGHPFELRSAPSAPVTVLMKDTFPPKPPVGVEAIAGKLNSTPGIDLSWAPNTEKDVAGYIVYRQEVTDGRNPVVDQRVTPALVLTPAFHDASVARGSTYVYTVVAVDTTGNQSLPSVPAREEVPSP